MKIKDVNLQMELMKFITPAQAELITNKHFVSDVCGYYRYVTNKEDEFNLEDFRECFEGVLAHYASDRVVMQKIIGNIVSQFKSAKEVIQFLQQQGLDASGALYILACTGFGIEDEDGFLDKLANGEVLVINDKKGDLLS